MAWRCSLVWLWLPWTPTNSKWPGDVIYIGLQVELAILSRYPTFCVCTGVSESIEPVHPVTLSFRVSIGVLTADVEPPVRPVPCTGASPVHPVLKRSSPSVLSYTGASLRCTTGKSGAEESLLANLSCSQVHDNVLAPTPQSSTTGVSGATLHFSPGLGIARPITLVV